MKQALWPFDMVVMALQDGVCLSVKQNGLMPEMCMSPLPYAVIGVCSQMKLFYIKEVSGI